MKTTSLTTSIDFWKNRKTNLRMFIKNEIACIVLLPLEPGTEKINDPTRRFREGTIFILCIRGFDGNCTLKLLYCNTKKKLSRDKTYQNTCSARTNFATKTSSLGGSLGASNGRSRTDTTSSSNEPLADSCDKRFLWIRISRQLTHYGKL